MDNIKCIDSITTIDLDLDFKKDLKGGEMQPGMFQLYPLANTIDGLKAREQLRTIEEIMKLPSHPNIPRMAARAIDIQGPRYIGLKDVGVTFETVQDNLTDSERRICIEQLKWAIVFLHNHDWAHGNILMDNLRVQRHLHSNYSSIKLQLIGLENSKRITSQNDWQEDLTSISKIGEILKLAHSSNLRYSIEINGSLGRVTYEYATGKLIPLGSEHIYVCKGAFSTISIDNLTHDQISIILKISKHARFVTIYESDTVQCPFENELLTDYYPDGELLEDVIHGTGCYSMKDVLEWIDQLCQAAGFIGDLNLVHGSIRPQNIIKYGRQLKLIGLENIYKETRDIHLDYLPYWSVPINQKSASRAADEHSLKVVFQEMFTRRYIEDMLESRSISDKIIGLELVVLNNLLEDDYRDFFFERVVEIFAAACDIGRTYLHGHASLYHIGMIARLLNLIPDKDDDIAPNNDGITRESLPFQHWHLLEISDMAPQIPVYFQPTKDRHITWQSSAPLWSDDTPNKAILTPCHATLCESYLVRGSYYFRSSNKAICWHSHIDMNRELFYKEAIQITAPLKIEKLGATLKLIFFLDKKEAYSDSFRGYSFCFLNHESAMIYRITDELAVVHQIDSKGMMVHTNYIYSPLESILRLEIQDKVENITLKHITGRELWGTKYPRSRNTSNTSYTSNTSNTSNNIKTLGISVGALRPEIDLFLVRDQECKSLGKRICYGRNNHFDVSRELYLETLEYAGTNYCLLRVNNLQNGDELSHEPFSIFSDSFPAKFGAYGSPVFLNLRGFVRDKTKVTCALLDHVEGNLWDDVISNDSYGYELADVYKWMKQISEALELLQGCNRKIEYSCKVIFITSERNVKMSYFDLANFDRDYAYDSEYEDESEPEEPESQWSTRYLAPECDYQSTAEQRSMFTLGTVIWDLIHKRRTISHPNGSTSRYAVPQQGVPWNEKYRNTLECWSTDPKLRPTHEEIQTFARKMLTEKEIGYKVLGIDFQSDKLPSKVGGNARIFHSTMSTNRKSMIYKAFDDRMKSKYRTREVEMFRMTIGNELFPQCFGIVGTCEHIKGILMEEMFGDMHDKIINNRSLKYRGCEISSWASQIGSALLFLHDRRIIHRDIKPYNILVHEDFKKVKVSDFGIISFSDKTTNWQGTERYVAPEVRLIERGRFSEKTDVYAFGVTLFELVERKDFVYRENEDVVVSDKKDHAHLSFFIKRCCSHNPYLRPDTREIVRFLTAQNELFKDSPTLEIEDDIEIPKKKVKFSD